MGIFVIRKWAPLFETARCLLYFPFDYYIAMNTMWEMGSGDKVVFDIFIAGLRLFFLSSAVIWLIRTFTRDDGRDYGNVKSNGNANGKMEESKTTKENGDLSENIELAKKMVAKRQSEGFNLANITAALIFLVVSLTATYVLYFVRLDSCNQLINFLKH